MDTTETRHNGHREIPNPPSIDTFLRTGEFSRFDQFAHYVDSWELYYSWYPQHRISMKGHELWPALTNAPDTLIRIKPIVGRGLRPAKFQAEVLDPEAVIHKKIEIREKYHYGGYVESISGGGILRHCPLLLPALLRSEKEPFDLIIKSMPQQIYNVLPWSFNEDEKEKAVPETYHLGVGEIITKTILLLRTFHFNEEKMLSDAVNTYCRNTWERAVCWLGLTVADDDYQRFLLLYGQMVINNRDPRTGRDTSGISGYLDPTGEKPLPEILFNYRDL